VEGLVEKDALKIQDFVSAKVFPEVVELDALLGRLGPHLTADLFEIFAKFHEPFVESVHLELRPTQRFPGKQYNSQWKLF